MFRSVFSHFREVLEYASTMGFSARGWNQKVGCVLHATDVQDGHHQNLIFVVLLVSHVRGASLHVSCIAHVRGASLRVSCIADD